MLDLKAELAEIHGEPYEGREVEGGTEDMEFSVRPTDWLFTDGRFRQAVGWDYHYRCEVIYTFHGADEAQMCVKSSIPESTPWVRTRKPCGRIW